MVFAALLFLLTADAAAPQPTGSPEASLAIHTLIVRREPMLDVLEAGDRLLVLGPDSIATYPRADALVGAPPSASIRIAHMRPWPRDLRGRLRLTAAGFDALLPGVICRGTLQPFAASCAEENDAWPIGLDNTGIMPSRNVFTTPEGLAFFGAAPIASSGSSRWLIADASGSLAFLDASRSVVSRAGAADDVVRLSESCAGGPYVIAVTPATAADHDDLRLLRVAGATLTQTAAFSMPGVVLALWAQPGARSATAVVHNGSRYEAHQISLACAR